METTTYEEIVLDKKTPIGDSGLYLRSSKLGEILTGAQEPKVLPVGSAYYEQVKPRSFATCIEEGYAARFESHGYFCCSYATETEPTKEIQGKVQPIGSQWNTGTESESMDGHWKKAVRRTPKDGFRQKFPSPRKGENLKAPKLNEKRNPGGDSQYWIRFVVLERIKEERRLPTPSSKSLQKKNQYGQWNRRKKKNRNFNEDHVDNGYGQLGNGRKIQWKFQKKSEGQRQDLKF